MSAAANNDLFQNDNTMNTNPNGVSLGALNDGTGTGGYGGATYGFVPIGGGGGGGGNVVYGCTDPAASNYNAAASYNDGSCLYAPTNVYNTQNLVVEILIQSNPQDLLLNR